ncbi:MAG TPA: acyl-CoA reductase [Flavobacteriaceae bacterium]|nr:acyl-CoA reductase [Flavobacteriaceae bacterium]
MELEIRKRAFVELGRFLSLFSSENPELSLWSKSQQKIYFSLLEKTEQAVHHNGWFTKENVLFTFENWSNALSKDNLEQWLSNYDFPNSPTPKTVGIVMAGNIPLVGFHDFLSVLLSGHKVLVKQSSNDRLLLPLLAEFLINENPKFADRIKFTDGKLENFDAVIATGSNNTARYFEHYFSAKPSIIRKNRNSVAVLSGKETTEELTALGEDIFRYFGLGCRNVSKLYVPEKYAFDLFFKAIYNWHSIVNHAKYANNYDYNKAVYLMSDFKILDNGFLLLKEDSGFGSPIATVFYETYSDLKHLNDQLKKNKAELQCVVSNGTVENNVEFGKTQQPQLWDYADGVDTLDFLIKL